MKKKQSTNDQLIKQGFSFGFGASLAFIGLLPIALVIAAMTIAQVVMLVLLAMAW